MSDDGSAPLGENGAAPAATGEEPTRWKMLLKRPRRLIVALVLLAVAVSVAVFATATFTSSSANAS